jgi:hypothetical protein
MMELKKLSFPAATNDVLSMNGTTTGGIARFSNSQLLL